MLTADQALSFAKKHVETWNSHDLRAILALYADSAELYSPLAATLRGDGAVRGQAALSHYFQQGLAKYPDLRFEVLDVFSCQTSVTLLLVGAGGRRVCEVLFLDEAGKVSRVYAHYLCDAAP